MVFGEEVGDLLTNWFVPSRIVCEESHMQLFVRFLCLRGFYAYVFCGMFCAFEDCIADSEN